MRLRLALAVVGLQVLALAYLAGEREWILRTGQTVLLRTAPVDPRDPMRGDYARLSYDISRIPLRQADAAAQALLKPNQASGRQPERRLYATLRTNADGIADVTGLTAAKPTDGLFIRGFGRATVGENVNLRYGVEALFLEQGKSRQLEDQRVREQAGRPLDVEVALGSGGIAVIKGYRWEALGLTVTTETEPAPVPPTGGTQRQARPVRRVIAVTAELKNHGNEEVAIVDLPDGRSLRLVPDERWNEARYQWVGAALAAPAPGPEHVILLMPGQTHRIKIDLSRAEWFVVDAKAAGSPRPIPLREIGEAWGAPFRLHYTPPPAAATRTLPHADRIRHSPLVSRVFNTQGVD